METKLHFSAPGRTEISGNHTDHQRGCVLAAAVNLETTAEVTPTDTGKIRIFSQGYAPVEIALDDLSIHEEERNTTAALVRGVASAFRQRGCVLSGFDAYVQSTVLPGSGLSSSAAFEVLLGRILNGMFFENRLTAVELAQIGQYAENVYFGKPCGLMDQMASSVGGLVFIDFADNQNPVVERVDYDFATCGYRLCIIDSGADHADLTDDYAAIPREMGAVASYFGCEVLRQVSEEQFYEELSALRKVVGDRAVLRSMHFFEENRRVQRQVQALRSGDMEAFLREVNASGESSWQYLQNVLAGEKHQEMGFALAVAKHYLHGQGACRIHGGGFAGTMQAFVPEAIAEEFVHHMEQALGEGSCHLLTIC